MKEDDIDVPFGVEPSSVQKIKEHFTGTKTDAEVYAEKELGQLMDKELTEQLLAEYLKICEEVKLKTELKDTLRAELISLAGQERGAIQRGKHILEINDKAGRVTIDYDRFILDTIGEKPLKQLKGDVQLVKDGKATCTWVKVGKPSVEVSVSKVN